MFSYIFSDVVLRIFLGITNEEKIEGIQIGIFVKKLIDEVASNGFTDVLGILLGKKFMNLGLRKSDRSISKKI